MNLTCFVPKGNLYERFCETHIQRAHSQTEIERLLLSSGFENIQVYDCFTMQAPNKKTERLQFAAQIAKP